MSIEYWACDCCGEIFSDEYGPPLMRCVAYEHMICSDCIIGDRDHAEEDDYPDYLLPPINCPICQMKSISAEDETSLLYSILGLKTKHEMEKSIKKIFGSYDNFKKHLRENNGSFVLDSFLKFRKKD